MKNETVSQDCRGGGSVCIFRYKNVFDIKRKLLETGENAESSDGCNQYMEEVLISLNALDNQNSLPL